MESGRSRRPSHIWCMFISIHKYLIPHCIVWMRASFPVQFYLHSINIYNKQCIRVYIYDEIRTWTYIYHSVHIYSKTHLYVSRKLSLYILLYTAYANSSLGFFLNHKALISHQVSGDEKDVKVWMCNFKQTTSTRYNKDTLFVISCTKKIKI